MGSTQEDVVARFDGKERVVGWVCFVSEVERGL
jgi:predicted RNA-binding protein with TRAM domain